MDANALHPTVPGSEATLRSAAPVLPELLAPAGDWDCVRAAVENGADAIYFGLDQFNARMRARNFTAADLPALMEFLHRRGVRGYLTFNTLVFPAELDRAREFVRSMIRAGVDAAIVQDVGICRLIRQVSPDFPIHASTQMTITSVAGVEFARDLGCNLVVLARELPVTEIAKITEVLVHGSQFTVQGCQPSTINHQPSATPRPALEVFIHGALCVAYSGQCLTSESLGGRSANRGVCAQACRLPFELIADGKTLDLGDRRYLLSPQDLAGVEALPDLIRAGVASLKIEGRLKSPEYVANITRVYRQAIDAVHAAMARSTPGAAADATAREVARTQGASARYDLEMAFSRGLYSGWLRGVNNQELVHGRFGKKRGVLLGTLTRVRDAEVSLRLQGPLKPGDGVVFDAGRPDLAEEGGRIYEVLERGGETVLRFGRGDLDFSRLHVGDRVWKTSDPELDRRLRQSFAGDQPRCQRPVAMTVRGRAGEPLELRMQDDQGHGVDQRSTMPLAPAERRPLTPQSLRDQLGRLGGTPFRLDQLHCELEGPVILPVSELNRLRREAVQQLESLRSQPRRWTIREAAADHPPPATRSPQPDQNVQLVVLVRNLAQLDAALQTGQHTLYCDFEDPKKYREAVQHFRAARVDQTDPSDRSDQSDPSAPAIWIAPPRIFKTGEDWTLKQVRSSEADGYLVRNYDHLRYFADCRRIGDFSLNVANALAAEYFIQRFGLEHVTASYDLNAAQLEALLGSAPPGWFEITLHQHMPMFHMEHCLFCAFLSRGTDYTNCGRPCDTREVKLRDRVGAEHPVKADAGCRNTVFNARAQTGAEHAATFLALGARRFRLEFLNETPDEVTETIRQYRHLLRGELSGAQLWRSLQLLNHLGVTRGPEGD